jgi:aspartyl-tRNA synthetase
MHPYRTHNCGALRTGQVGATVRLSGWVHRKRDHGQLLFIDLRDHYGITQVVFQPEHPFFADAANVRLESVLTVTGHVVARSPDTVNPNLPTGEVEVVADALLVEAPAEQLPLQVNAERDYPEDTRLRFRFLDLRRESMQQNVLLRSRVVSSIRRRMEAQGFVEFQTPILTASSPEGARDFLVPSRLHPGKFYALPQAPQQYKQLLMVSGFDRYFQIAPCFRDEDPRADRLPGEFYQLDVEMSFVTQEDVWAAIEPVIRGVFYEFAEGRAVTPTFPRIRYAEAMLKYGTDKPDLRNPLVIADVTELFAREEVTFNAFKTVIRGGGVVRAIPAPGAAAQPRSFFDKLNEWARAEGAAGLGYVVLEEEGGKLSGKGPIAKFIPAVVQADIAKAAGVRAGDAVFFSAGGEAKAATLAGKARARLGEDLGVGDKDQFAFAWITDFPMYEWDEDEKKIEFSHNPFSMPNIEPAEFLALDHADKDRILALTAFQYDMVCNGYEIASGAIRNHRPDVMKKAFGIAGYAESVLEERFGGMYRAFQYGAPPHGGMAAGIDRIVMLLCGAQNLREITMFPMNQRAEDLLLGAPSEVAPKQLRELSIRLNLPEK